MANFVVKSEKLDAHFFRNCKTHRDNKHNLAPIFNNKGIDKWCVFYINMQTFVTFVNIMFTSEIKQHLDRKIFVLLQKNENEIKQET